MSLDQEFGQHAAVSLRPLVICSKLAWTGRVYGVYTEEKQRRSRDAVARTRVEYFVLEAFQSPRKGRHGTNGVELNDDGSS